MELRVLNDFLAIAREESFTKAANMLHKSILIPLSRNRFKGILQKVTSQNGS